MLAQLVMCIDAASMDVDTNHFNEPELSVKGLADALDFVRVRF